MSRCFDINCHDCRESLWIGQRDYIYTGDAEVMADLKEFLFKHEGHRLTFEYDEKNEYPEFERQKPDGCAATPDLGFAGN